MKVCKLLILGLFLSFAGNAESFANTCNQLFSNDVQYTFKELEAADLKVQVSKLKSTVKVVSQTTDKEGTSLLILNKIGSSWYSTYTPAPNNFHGDPRWFPMLMGGKVGHYFGFRKISDDLISAPTAETLNRKIEKINEKLVELNREPIGIRFYETSEKPQTNFDYLRKILEESSLPMARTGHYAIHDISYHSQSILISKKILDQIKIRIKLVLNLKEKIDSSKELTLKERKTLQNLTLLLAEQLTERIDWGAGNIGYVFLTEKRSYNPNSILNDTSGMETHVKGYLLTSTKRIFMNLIKTHTRTGTPNIERFLKNYLTENNELIKAMNIKPTKREDVLFVWDRINTISEAVNKVD